MSPKHYAAVKKRETFIKPEISTNYKNASYHTLKIVNATLTDQKYHRSYGHARPAATKPRKHSSMKKCAILDPTLPRPAGKKYQKQYCLQVHEQSRRALHLNILQI